MLRRIRIMPRPGYFARIVEGPQVHFLVAEMAGEDVAYGNALITQ